MTRFKKGSKVEVWDQREVPSGCWRSAQIISGNGHTYYVKYDGDSSAVGDNFERVPRKALRPCPPMVEPRRAWVAGDVIEVYKKGSWKIARISSVAGSGNLFVRLFGSSRQFRAHESDVRLRQSWKADKWVVLVQDFGNCTEKLTGSSKESNGFYMKSQKYAKLNQYAGVRDDYTEEPSCKLLKRRRGTCLVPHERCNEGGRRRKAARQEQYDQEVAVLPSRLVEKVDAVISPQLMMGEKYMRASFNNGTGFSELDRTDNENSTMNLDRTESTSSSVGSCSISGSPYRLMHGPITECSEDICIYSDDTQNCSGPREEPTLARREESPQNIHELELHAYRTTMAALHTSGSISWEQEALLTNLRLMLHISNDEHLAEIRNLVSLE